MDEFSFIEKYLRPLTFGNKASLGLTDDAAVLAAKVGYDTVITKDAIAEGTHFFKGDEPFNLARKLMRVNISDLAAKGAQPYCCFVALALPKNTGEKWLKDFAAGLKCDLEEFGCFLAGGDTTTHDGALVLTLTAIGYVDSGTAMLRSGAAIGDYIFVTGTLGDSYLGLKNLLEQQSLNGRQGYSPNLSPPTISHNERYHLPQPRLNVGINLRGIATSCVDISDGLLADLNHICECSNVGAEILLGNVPLSEHGLAEEKKDPAFRIKAITAGDDYELLFTAPENMGSKIAEIAQKSATTITKIGKITKGNSAIVLDASGNAIEIRNSGYKHPVG